MAAVLAAFVVIDGFAGAAELVKFSVLEPMLGFDNALIGDILTFLLLPAPLPV